MDLPKNDISAGLSAEQRELLDKMTEPSHVRIEPVASSTSPTGIAFPLVNQSLNLPGGMEPPLLDDLAAKGLLAKVPCDEILACPHCRSADFAVSENCRACRDAFVRKDGLIHHYRCSWIAPRKEYEGPHGLTCPKCHRNLDHVGVDYDIPGDFYQCSGCWKKYGEEKMAARCRKCARNFPAEAALRLQLHAYVLTPLGKGAKPGKVP
ncbi:MAG: hypothetical protein K8R69_04330 [Deltaproteobacteria bacterium]|nr:hypothetical protein [Deltaproteobacteria bacterium]